MSDICLEAHMKAQALACVLDLKARLQRSRELTTQKCLRMLEIGNHMGFDVHVYPDCFQLVKDGKTV